MERFLSWVLRSGAVLFLLLLAVWSVSKLMGSSREEREALALMSQDAPMPAGRNAFAALWLLEYDVPAAQRDAVLAEDVRRFAATPLPLPLQEAASTPAFETVAKSRFRNIAPNQAARKALCSPREDCLAKVRADLPAYAALTQAHSQYLAQAEQVATGTHLRNPFPPRPDMPMPLFQQAYSPATALALRFAQGDRRGAMAGACRQVKAWRGHVANADSLIIAMVGSAYVTRGYTPLLADMLAEWPLGEALPADCDAALASPAAEEGSMCPAMRGEFAFMGAGLAYNIAAQKDQPAWKKKLLFDETMTRAAMARDMAPFCQPQGMAAMANDQPLTFPPRRSLWRTQCVANAIGCILGEVAGPGYERYADRRRDQVAVMRAMAGLAWWRGQSALHAKPGTIVQQLPPQFHAAAHPLRYDAARDALIVPLLQQDDQGANEVVLPLPGSRVAKN